MPIRGEVYGSTLGDMVHRGPNQAGNKSMLSYRCDTGVPGYTGFIPTNNAIIIPNKTVVHTGKPVDSATHEGATRATMTSKATASEYFDKFQKVPSDTKPFSKTGGGYWFSQATGLRSNPGTSKPFLATTTYRAELIDSEETAAKQMNKTKDLACTVVHYDVARQRAEAGTLGATTGAEGRAGSSFTKESNSRLTTQRPATAVTSYGDVVGYQTTKAAMLVQSPLTGGSATGGFSSGERVRPATVPNEVRYQTMPRAMPPGMFGDTSSYGVDYGADGSDPMQRTAPAEKFMTRLSTTRDLAEGTTRNTNNVPGYTGHQSQYKHNTLARAHADAADERSDVKKEMLLYSLDQYSRTRVPNYTGYKPQAAKNVTLTQPSMGSTTETTFGDAAYRATKNGVPYQDHSHHNNSNAGIMSFFTSTGVTISDNGLSNAQLYYKHACPGEGRFQTSRECHQTTYGAPFKAKNSLV
eukprot:gene13088-3616_t